MLKVVELKDQEDMAWDAYVLQSRWGCPYHLSGWKRVMENTYGHASKYLMVKSGGQIVGVLPLIELKSQILGHSMTSLPGGICAESEQAALALVERAKEITRDRGARFFSLRDSMQMWDARLVSMCDHCNMILELPGDSETLWASLDKRLRRHIKIASKNDVQVKMGGKECLEEFYSIYQVFLRDVGTPTFGRQFLQNVVDEFGDRILICCLECGGNLVGAYMAFTFQDAILGAWGGSVHKYYDQRPNHMIYWQYMQYGCEHGFKRINLGRSQKGSGPYKFKKGWGAKPKPIYQQFFLNKASQPPLAGSKMEDDIKFRIFVNVWKHLPLMMAETLGPKLRRHIPFA